MKLVVEEEISFRIIDKFEAFENDISDCKVLWVVHPTIPLFAVTKAKARNVGFLNLSRWQFNLYQLVW